MAAYEMFEIGDEVRWATNRHPTIRRQIKAFRQEIGGTTFHVARVYPSTDICKTLHPQILELRRIRNGAIEMPLISFNNVTRFSAFLFTRGAKKKRTRRH